jgi:hypothetical protein
MINRNSGFLSLNLTKRSDNGAAFGVGQTFASLFLKLRSLIFYIPAHKSTILAPGGRSVATP